jgi:AraC-like DNA-binding protein
LFVFGLINTRQLLNPVVIAPPKPVPEAKLAAKINTIEAGIHEQKLFLESNINLERFAEQIGLRSRDVSAVLKLHYHSNFFEFINGYRVEEAKRLLALPEYKDETILEVIFKSGFNSPSAFHRFFKRMVGVTPTEYRKQAIEAAKKG